MTDSDPASEAAKAAQAIAKASEKALDTAQIAGGFLGKYIRGPLDQVSGMLEDQLRFTRWERRVRLMTRAQEIAEQACIPLTPDHIPLNVAVPLLLDGSLEEDDDLQDRYARLLVNAANKKCNVQVRRMHGDILSQLGSLEVQMLDALYNGRHITGALEGVLGALLPDEVVSDYWITKRYPDKNAPDASEEKQVALFNLIRVGCVMSASMQGSFTPGTKWVAITQLGINFTRACTVEDS